MSTQLILYPQYYNGFNSTSSTYNQFVVNGGVFTGLNSTDLHSTTFIVPYQSAMYSQPPSIVNTWYRFTTSGGATWGAVTAPQEALNNLVLSYNGTTLGHTGVYQQMSGLVVGADYDVVIDIETAAVGVLGIRIFEGASLTLTNVSYYSSNVSLITHTFTCTATNQTLFLDYASTTANLIIDTIKCTEGGQNPTQTYTDLQDGQVICDLYQEEDIPLTLSVDDFKNVAEKVQSYSKDFDLPATKRNNQIFDNVFEITRTDTGINFNPYVKTKCTLKQDGFILFDGYLRLINIKDQEGEISYNVNLYSEVVALADILKDRTFADLSFEELAHTYNKTEIKRSWNDSGTGITYPNANTSGYRDAYNTVKYPFVDWSHQILISNGTSGTAGYPQLTTLQQVFRPFINIKYLINRIFQDTPFTWTSNFFDTADFDKLFIDFNWGADSTPTGVDITTITSAWAWSLDLFGNESNYADTTFSVLNLRVWGYWGTPISQVPPNYDTSTNIITSTVDNETYDVVYSYTIENVDTVDRTVECQWLYTTGSLTTPINNSGTITIPASGIWTYSGSFSRILLTTGDTLKAEFKSDDATGTKIRQYQTGSSCIDECNSATVNWGLSVTAFIGSNTMQILRGELGQWEFLKGIMTMFNLVSLPDKDNPLNITFEPYGDVFITDTAGTNLAARSIQHDWTDKVDVSEMELKPLTDLNKQTIFKFAEDEADYTFKLYKGTTQNHLYGSKEFDASGFTILEGIDEIIAEPFAATVPKPLFEQFGDFITPAIFSANDEATEFEGFDNSPRIMYNNGVKTLNGGVTYYIPAQNGLSSENQPDFLQFSHLSTVPTAAGTLDFHFGECQYFNPIGAAVPDNLFNLYWLPYYNELYNPNTRTMTLKVSLTPADINVFKMSDKVMIKNRVFRVNKIEYKPNDLAKVEFILIP